MTRDAQIYQQIKNTLFRQVLPLNEHLQEWIANKQLAKKQNRWAKYCTHNQQTKGGGGEIHISVSFPHIELDCIEFA